MHKLSKWIGKKVNRAHIKNDDLKSSQPALPAGLPVLPAKRQDVLTPSPSREQLLQNATAESPFFQRLPPEVRRRICIAAFGGRTVHMDLRFDYPEPAGPCHARLNGERMHQRDRTAQRDWHWWSCVCHRNPGLEGWADQCRTGLSNYTTCFLYPGKMPDKCFLGVMGWLLTCRQAYMEGLDVLYSTNMVHMGSVVLMRHLPLLLPAQRLANIASLELAWDLVLFRTLTHPQREQEVGWPAYNALISTVASAFPGLRKLYISIQTNDYIPDPLAKYIKSHEQKLLVPIDEMVRRLGSKLRDCQIALPLSLHGALMYGAKRTGARVEIDSGVPGGLSSQRFWRPVTMEQDEYSGNDTGYWVRQGLDDTPVSCNFGEPYS